MEGLYLERGGRRSLWIHLNVLSFLSRVLGTFEMEQMCHFEGRGFPTGSPVVLASDLHEFAQMDICL